MTKFSKQLKENGYSAEILGENPILLQTNEAKCILYIDQNGQETIPERAARTI